MSSNVTVVQTRCRHCFPSKENHVNPISNQQQIETNDLKIRLWLEGVAKRRDATQFVRYDLLIPSLK